MTVGVATQENYSVSTTGTSSTEIANFGTWSGEGWLFYAIVSASKTNSTASHYRQWKIVGSFNTSATLGKISTVWSSYGTVSYGSPAFEDNGSSEMVLTVPGLASHDTDWHASVWSIQVT